MMKWSKNKSSSSSSSSSRQPPLISHVLPTSWFSKFKQMSIDSSYQPTKAKPKAKQNSLSPSSGSAHSVNLNEGRFFAASDDSCWRLSFGEGRFEGGLKSVWYDSQAELDVNLPSTRSFKSRVKDKARKRGDWPCRMEFSQGNRACEVGRQEFIVPRRKSVKGQKLRKTSQRALEEKGVESERKLYNSEKDYMTAIEKEMLAVEAVMINQTRGKNYQESIASQPRKRSISFPNSNLRTIVEDCVFEPLNQKENNAFSEDEINAEWQKLKDLKIKGLLLKNEKQRKSVYISRESQKRRTKQSGKVRAYSPRTAARNECKIKALEDFKKAKLKKVSKERSFEDKKAFDSFAVVKTSINPQQDFRDSMVQMITEKQIRKPEELEELLACYLTLNCDEYHDLIIKVFRQVWFEMKLPYNSPELQNEQLFH